MEALLIEASSFRSVCFKWRVFSQQELILSLIVRLTLKEWPVLRNKLNYTHTKIGAKVQPHEILVLIVYPTIKLFTICLGLWCFW